MASIGLILLAAGGSTRLGTPKQLLTYQGQTLLRRAAETALASVCRPVVVVLGAQAARLQEELAGLAVQIVENPHWAEGMGTSLRAGLDALTETQEGAVVCLCDQPLLSADIIDALVTAHDDTEKPIAACEYDGTVGVPALFSRALFSELRALKEGAKPLLRRHASQIAIVPFPGGDADIDTPEDAAQYLRDSQGLKCSTCMV